MRETMSARLNAEEMCRACMRVDGVLLPMYDGQLGSKNLPVKLAELTSIQINRFDGLPSKLCAKCAYRTDAFYDFKLQVQETEKKLRELLIEKHSLPIKLEATFADECDNVTSKSIENKKDSPTACAKTCKEESTDSDYVQNSVKEVETLENKRPSVKPKVFRNNRTGAVKKETMISNFPERVTEDQEMICKSEDSPFTVVYLPEVSEPSSIPESQSFVLVNHGPAEENTDSLESWISEKSADDQYAITHEMKSKPAIFFSGEMIKGEDSETEDRREVEEEETTTVAERSDEDEDSDYFGDSKDNILGSLNDTIIKIKEVTTDDDVLNYQCTLCMQNYEELKGALNHIVDNHIPASGPFFCTVCEKDCDSRRELRSHVKLHTGANPYVCFICNKAYAVKRYLKRHMVSHPEFYRHRCPKCGKRFKLKCELESHVTSHIHGSPYVCSQCPRVFNHKGNYKRHLISHLDPQGLVLPKFPCKICKKRFLNNRTLETHIRVHTGEKPFKCDICKKSFSQQGNLINHIRIHSNPRSYTCEVCGKQFNQRATLKDHSLLHTGEKPYVCTVCGIAFTFSAALRRHMWTHANGKPYGCEICDARFVGRYDLKRHMGIHSDRPRSRRRRNQNKEEETNFHEQREESNAAAEETPGNTETILIEQVLLDEDVAQVVTQEESEKENVDALFTLIQYAE